MNAIPSKNHDGPTPGILEHSGVVTNTLRTHYAFLPACQGKHVKVVNVLYDMSSFISDRINMI